MNKCYDSLDEQFVCQLQKIRCLYAQEVFQLYKVDRFGVVSKRSPHGLRKLKELRDIMLYLEGFDLSQVDPNTYRNKIYQDAQITANASAGCMILPGLDICNVSDILETINSL